MLETVQRFMQAFIVDPGTDEQALARANRAAGLQHGERMVLPSATLQPAERLQIYRNMYLLRMEEALTLDYPGLVDFLGPREFFRLVKAYVQVHPSRSYTLDRLGDHLPDFLARSRSFRPAPFLRDMARLELAVTVASQLEEESPVLTPEGLGALPMEAWERARLVPVATLKLLEVGWNVHSYLRAVGHDSPRPGVQRKRDYLVVWRNGTQTWRMSLPRPGFRILSRLVEGAPLSEALASERAAPARVFDWFSSWVGEGFFTRLEL